MSHRDNPHSLVLALDYRVGDIDRTWSLIRDDHTPLLGLGARHAVLYTSVSEPDRVLVTIGLRHRLSVTELLRSPAVFEWFDRSGVNDLPAIFAGEVREKINLTQSGAEQPGSRGPEVIVGVVSTVADPADLMAKVHRGLDRFADAGVRKVWVYQAVDDGNEVMTLLEIDNAASAQRWIDHPDTAAEWMTAVGAGGYPGPFVGKFAAAIDLMAPVGDGR
ncbi:fatty-acid--CoA ligase [Mycolicibacter terrae]|uniref:Fatty-acid--CoA ligase n=1 Tax=Mycolicibacter terrae TaxID=1788 RepID=A0AAD1I2L8_9MYCO|nr:fatty-acid--CoA ligase [Mycolicibacter terrae]ORW97560.1 fatty-acid--CoA ligase [Mycolicibacter terrae]BBX22726.1 fatty-acid--CoA ligase [Mycolicibacter terrae]SNV72312.1 fatty-acid--CoA ligase [Mycolicibacter terrae]